MDVWPFDRLSDPRDSANPDGGAADAGAADDTAALQAAIDSAIRNHRGGSVALPRGSYRVSGTLTLASVDGLHLRLEPGSELIWTGKGDTSRLFLLRDCRLCLFENVVVVMAPGAVLGTAFWSENGGGGVVVPTACIFRNCRVRGDGGTLNRGWRWVGTGAGGDANNEHNRLEHCSVEWYRESAYSIEHSQSKRHVFRSCSFYAAREYGGTGRYGVHCASGSFVWDGGGAGGGGNSVADFHLGQPTDPITIEGADLENSSRLLETPSAYATGVPVSIRGCRWESNRAAEDGEFIRFRWTGPLVVEENSFGTSGQDRHLKIVLATYAGEGITATFRANDFSCAGSVNRNPLVLSAENHYQLTWEDNVFHEPGGPGATDATIDPRQRAHLNQAALGSRNPVAWRTRVIEYYGDSIGDGTGPPHTLTNLEGGWHGREVVVVFRDLHDSASTTTGDPKTVVRFSGTIGADTYLVGNAGVDWRPAEGEFLVCRALRKQPMGSSPLLWYCEVHDSAGPRP